MKKHIKPIIFLVALILLTSIVGCGPKGNSDNTVDAKSNEEEDKNEDTENSNTNEEDLKDKYEAFDLGGRTIKFLGQACGTR